MANPFAAPRVTVGACHTDTQVAHQYGAAEIKNRQNAGVVVSNAMKRGTALAWAFVRTNPNRCVLVSIVVNS